MRSPLLPHWVPTASGRSGISPLALALTIKRVVPPDPGVEEDRIGHDLLLFFHHAIGVDPVDVQHPPLVVVHGDVGHDVQDLDTHMSRRLRGGEIGDVDGVLAPIVHAERDVAVGERRLELAVSSARTKFQSTGNGTLNVSSPALGATSRNRREDW